MIQTTIDCISYEEDGYKLDILPEELDEVAELFGMSRNEYITIHGKTYSQFQVVIS